MTNGYLEHFGIRGMHWGHRKSKTWSSQNKPRASGKGTKQEKQKMSTKKKVAIGAAIVVGTLLAAYGGYKLIQHKKELKEAANIRSSIIEQNKQIRLNEILKEKLKDPDIKEATASYGGYTGSIKKGIDSYGRSYSKISLKDPSFSNLAKSGESALKKSSVVDDYTQELLRKGR